MDRENHWLRMISDLKPPRDVPVQARCIGDGINGSGAAVLIEIHSRAEALGVGSDTNDGTTVARQILKRCGKVFRHVSWQRIGLCRPIENDSTHRPSMLD